MDPIAFTLTNRDFQSAMRLYQWVRLRSVKEFMVCVFSPIIAAAIVYTIAMLRSFPAPFSLSVGVFLFSILFAVCFTLTMAWIAARSASQVPLNKLETVLAWTPDGTQWSTAKGESRLLWTDYFGYAVNESILILFISKTLFLPVPRRALSEAQSHDLMATIRSARVPDWGRFH